MKTNESTQKTGVESFIEALNHALPKERYTKYNWGAIVEFFSVFDPGDVRNALIGAYIGYTQLVANHIDEPTMIHQDLSYQLNTLSLLIDTIKELETM